MNTIALFTSGGDSPGMNACLRSVVRSAIHNNLKVIGFVSGYQGIIDNNFVELESKDVANIIKRGGTILKTARSEDFMTIGGREKAYLNIKKNGIEGLVCIGGDGSYKGAATFLNEYKIPIIGIPGTIDNDINGTDYTLGFDTALNTVIDAIDKIRDTAEAHSRVFFVEVMGRKSGKIALYSGLASGAEAIMIPEKTNEFEDFCYQFEHKKRNKEFSIVVVAEGDEDGSAFELARKFKLKFPKIDTKVTVLGHIQRGGNPTVKDRIAAARYGVKAVSLLLEGKSGLAIGESDNKLTLTPLSETSNNVKFDNDFLWKMMKILSI